MARSVSWKKYDLLCTAVKKQFTEIAKALLTSGSKVNDENSGPSNTPLHFAAVNGDVEIVQMLLDRGANIDAENLNGETALYNAVESIKTEIIGVLLNRGANVDAADKDSFTPLHIAVGIDNKESTRLLLSRGANVNATTFLRGAWNEEHAYTPLHIAASKGNEEIIELLVRSGANVDAKGTDGVTSLHIAATHGYLQIVERLLKHSADVNSAYTSGFRDGYTPMHMAVENGSEDIFKLLLSGGTNVNSKGQRGVTCLHIASESGYSRIVEHLLKHEADVNSACFSFERWYTPMHLAAEKGHEDIIKLLLSGGANVNSKGEDGVTCLHIASQRGYSRIVEHLLKHEADINSEYSEYPEYPEYSVFERCYTPLHLAAEQGHEEIIKLLLSKGADANAGRHGVTPLHHATERGYLQIAEHLLKHGANIYSPLGKHDTPVYLAVRDGHEKLVKLLLERGANIDGKDREDKTILRFAVEKGSSKIVEHILKHSPDLNNESNSGVLNAAVKGGGIEYSQIVKSLLRYGFTIDPQDSKNLMHAAVENGYLEIVEELLEHGADVNMLYDSTCGKGYLPLHVAAKNGHEEIAKLLISYGVDVNAPDETGRTPIFYATENTHLKMAKLLLANNANARDDPELLTNAVRDECREMVEVLFQHGADVNAIDKCGRMPLAVVTLNDLDIKDLRARENIAKYLLRGGAINRVKNSKRIVHYGTANKSEWNSIDALDGRNFQRDKMLTTKRVTTPLHISVLIANNEIMEMLLKKGANVNAKDADRETALHYATEKGNIEVVELLLIHGAEVDVAGNYRRVTPLHIAAKFGYLDIVELLLKFGANIDSADYSGQTALIYASGEGDERIVTALLEHGSDVTIKTTTNYTALDFTVISPVWNYNGDFDDSDNVNVNVAKILKHHMVKIKAANLYAVNDAGLSIRSRAISSDHELRDFQNECKNEVASIKNEKFVNTYITFYDILTKDVNQLTSYARNESIAEACASGDYKIKFPIYASIINRNFRKGEKRREFLEQGKKKFYSLFTNFPELPRDCTERIFSYLNDDDVRALTDADKPAVYMP